MSNLERRDFIKKTIMGGIGATLLNGTASANLTPEMNEAAPGSKKSNHGPSKKIIVGGAGIGGLCCAYELMKKGHDVTVLEASGRHGGHIFTVHDGLSDGLYGDFGQEHIVKPGYKLYFEYARELGVETIPYPRRKGIQRRINGKFYTEEMLKDPAILRKFGFSEREVKYLSDNAWGEMQTLYTAPYLEKFTDEYQPFNIGYDELDKIPASDFLKKEGASKAAQEFLGGQGESALFKLWYAAILKLRGVPVFPTDVYRLKGGNQMLPNAFAKKLGARVWLSSPITSIKNGDTGVTVTYKYHNEEKQLSGDYFVNCIPLPAFRNISVQPVMSAEKQYVFDNLMYDSYSRFVFQASSKFWLDDGLPNINLFLEHPDLGDVWHSADEVDTHRVIVLGTGPGGVSPQRALAAFREVYPGKKDTIELAIGRDWTKETFSATCERLPFPIGQLKRFWPHVIKPEGRIHFAGAYADNLNWGTEAATRSANRVANEIDKA
jgi:monoamine oxidase